MVSLNNLQTCLACLGQHKEDCSKLSGDVNKNNSIDVVWNGNLYVSTYFNLVFFTPLWGNLVILQCHLGDCYLNIHSRVWRRRNWSGAVIRYWMKFQPHNSTEKRQRPDSSPSDEQDSLVSMKGWSSYQSAHRYISKLIIEAWYSSREYSHIQLKYKISVKMWKAFMSLF